MLYLDASALVKRYVSEQGSAELRAAMAAEDSWWMCRIGYVETARALTLAAGPRATRAFEREWESFGVVEIDRALAEHAAALTLTAELRSLAALHLAAALVLPSPGLSVATWDLRLHRAAVQHGLRTIPHRLS
jgi:predicted nucleic acid-binding protein